MYNFSKVIKKVNPKDLIIAKVIDDGIEKTKHFLVVGKDENFLYAIRMTPKNQSQNNNYRKCNSKFRNMQFYYRWNTIFKIGKDEFIEKRKTVSGKIYKEIIREMVKKRESYDNIDFLSANFLLKEGSIILKDENLYLVIDRLKDSNKYKIVKLEENINPDASIQIKGSKYGICFDETAEIGGTDNDFVVIFNAQAFLEKYIKKPSEKNCEFKEVSSLKNSNESYEFGYVLSLKNSNEKVIYLTQIKGIVYCVGFDQLELFTGILKVKKNKVEGFYRKLNDNELNKIALKLEKALPNDIYHIYSDDAKNSILDKVKSIKK